MTILAIILLVIFGILLIILEFFVIPGITVAGVGGLILLFISVYISFDVYGSFVGQMVVIGEIVIVSAMLIYTFRTNTWKKLSLKSEIKGKTNTHDENLFHIGDRGKTVTRLAPMGKIEVNDTIIEGKSTGAFIDQNKDIEVVKVLRNKLIVKLKTD